MKVVFEMIIILNVLHAAGTEIAAWAYGTLAQGLKGRGALCIIKAGFCLAFTLLCLLSYPSFCKFFFSTLKHD
jgi:hypothetical protein